MRCPLGAILRRLAFPSRGARTVSAWCRPVVSRRTACTAARRRVRPSGLFGWFRAKSGRDDSKDYTETRENQLQIPPRPSPQEGGRAPRDDTRFHAGVAGARRVRPTSAGVTRRQNEEVIGGHYALTRGSHDAELRVERDQRGSCVRGMDDVTWAAAEDRMELVLATCGKAHRTAILQAGEAIAEVPTPWPLANVARERTDIADLRGRYRFGRFGQNGVLISNHRMAGESVQRDETADVHAACPWNHLVEPLDGLQVDEHIRLDYEIFHQRQQIAATADK